MASFKTSHARALVLSIGLGVLSLSGAARAATEGVDSGADTTDSRSLGNHQRHLRFDLGARTQFIKGAGFDPFSEKDVLPQLSAQASWAFWAQDALSLAGVVAFDYGDTSARARSDQAELELERFTLAPELRYHVLRLLVVSAKLGPTLTREHAELRGGGLDSSLTKTAWKGGFDATAGAAFELWGYAKGTTRKPRLWVTAEGGYGWTAPLKLDLKPEDAGAVPQRLVAPTLDDLSISGPLFRVSLALSYW